MPPSESAVLSAWALLESSYRAPAVLQPPPGPPSAAAARLAPHVSAWRDALAELDDAGLAAAVRAYLRSDARGWPSPGALLQARGSEPAAEAAWARLRVLRIHHRRPPRRPGEPARWGFGTGDVAAFFDAVIDDFGWAELCHAARTRPTAVHLACEREITRARAAYRGSPPVRRAGDRWERVPPLWERHPCGRLAAALLDAALRHGPEDPPLPAGEDPSWDLSDDPAEVAACWAGLDAVGGWAELRRAGDPAACEPQVRASLGADRAAFCRAYLRALRREEATETTARLIEGPAAGRLAALTAIGGGE